MPDRDPESPEKVKTMIDVLGGIGIIRQVESVALTRLRIEVAESERVDEEVLRDAGAEGILRLPGDKLHLIMGLGADQFATEMKSQLA